MRLLLSAAVIAGIFLTGISQVTKAQGSLSIYSDLTFTQCTLSDTAPGVASVYVAMTWPGADWVRFRVAASPGFTGIWLGDTSPYHLYGSSQSDLSVVFSNCVGGKFLVLTLSYQLLGTSTCSELAIAAPAGFSVPFFDDCGFTELPLLHNNPLHVNCSGSLDCNPLAVQPSTWGSVKALYRN